MFCPESYNLPNLEKFIEKHLKVNLHKLHLQGQSL